MGHCDHHPWQELHRTRGIILTEKAGIILSFKLNILISPAVLVRLGSKRTKGKQQAREDVEESTMGSPWHWMAKETQLGA